MRAISCAIVGIEKKAGRAMKENEFENNLSHAHAAYVFAIRSLPAPTDLESGRVRMNGFEFSSESHIRSMLIELGWAFFCRYEACLEKYLKDNGVKLSKKCSLGDWLKNNGVQIPDDLDVGIGIYRKLRNALHHNDGASLNGEANTEIHILPDHMERFYKLFVWISQQVGNVNAQGTVKS